MMCDVKLFVWQCQTCQQLKRIIRRPAGRLQPLPMPLGIWEDLSLDFITPPSTIAGFHSYYGNGGFFFKRGTSWGSSPTIHSVQSSNFIPRHNFLHGLSRSFVSDHDLIFVSAFWKELFKLSGTSLRMSTAYHPQMDDQTKVMNRVVEQYPRSFVHSHPSN